MATRLSLYNGALLECGERDLASLTENREPRRLLDRVWDSGAVGYCLGKGQWKFAKRTRQFGPSASIEPAFGHPYAFEQPNDFIRTIGIWSDEFLSSPLLNYQTEGRFWFASAPELFVSYVSDDASYGGDLANWPEDFTRAVELYLASRIIRKLTQDVNAEKLQIAKFNDAIDDAKSGSAMEGPTVFPPAGSWVRARLGSSRGDGGAEGSLTS